MKTTLLSSARIAGEVGLAGGTVTGGTLAAKYGSQVASLKEEKADNTYKGEGVWNEINTMQTLITSLESRHSSLTNNQYWTSIKSALQSAESKVKK